MRNESIDILDFDMLFSLPESFPMHLFGLAGLDVNNDRLECCELLFAVYGLQLRFHKSDKLPTGLSIFVSLSGRTNDNLHQNIRVIFRQEYSQCQLWLAWLQSLQHCCLGLWQHYHYYQ